MRRHPKASAVGSTLGTGSSRARLPIAAVCLLVSLAFAGISASSAGAAPWGITGFSGSSTAAGGSLGGEFGAITEGSAAGIVPTEVAINDTTGDVYAADPRNNRIQRFDADGNFEWALGFDVIAPGKPGNIAQNEVQTVTIGGVATGGNFKLQWPAAANSTDPIPFGATPAQVKTALEAPGKTQIGAGNVSVTGPNGGPYAIEFTGSLADTNVAQAIGAGGELTPSGTVTIATTVEGGLAVEKCTVAANCKAGVSATTLGAAASVPGGGVAAPQGIGINQVTGDLYVSDAGFGRVQQFDKDGNFIRAWGRNVVQGGKAGDKPLASAVQTLTVTATGGKYTLEFKGQKTPELAFNASAATIQAALQALTTIGSGGALVAETSPGTYTITFAGPAHANNPEPNIVAAPGAGEPLAGGTASAATTTPGSNAFEICEVSLDCRRGENGFAGGSFSDTPAQGYVTVVPAGGTAPNPGNVIVGDGNRQRVQEFTATGQFVRAFGFDVAQPAASPASSSVFEICRAASFEVCKGGVAGNGTGQFASASEATTNIRVAVDSSGVIYTVESIAPSNFRVQKFTPAPGGGLTPSLFNPSITPLAGESAAPFPLTGTAAASSPTDVAIDPADDHVYVVKGCTTTNCPGPPASSERRVYEFDAAGTLLETHLAGYQTPAINGLAVKSGGAGGYLSSGSPKPGFYLAGPPTPPTSAIGSTTSVSSSCATFHGTVDPEGGGPLHTFYRFEYSADGGVSWGKTPVPDADAGSGEAAVAVEATACGLEANKHYEVRLLAIKGGSPVISTGNAGDFTTDPAGPIAQTFAAFWDVNAGELVLRGSVNPNNTATAYHFEYGTAPCSSSGCASAPASQDASAGNGSKALTVSRRVAGLAPSTTYHFRIVADNGVGAPALGGEGTITTPAAPPNPCLNQQFRTGASAALPECRAFEWVSNGDSWGSGIGSAGLSIADSGNRAQFSAQAFGQPQSAPGPSTPYIAERKEGSGWAVQPTVPAPTVSSGSDGGTQFLTDAELGGVLWPQSTPAQRMRGEVRWGTIALDGSEAWASDLLMPVAHTGPGSAQDEYTVAGGATDLSSFVFGHNSEGTGTGLALLAGEPLLTVRENSNLYQIRSGNLDIVNRDSGAVTPGNPLGVLGACGAGLGGNVKVRGTETRAGAVSADGEVVHFSIAAGTPPAPGSSCGVEGPKRLYKRIAGTTTVEVSACAKSTLPCTPTGNDKYRGASRDGGITFFLSPRQLVDADTDATEDLYVYDESLPPGERLIQASAGEAVAADHPVVGNGAEVQGVLDNAADGSRVYFFAKGRLTGAASKGAQNLYVFEPGSGEIGFIGTIANGETETAASFSYALPGGESGDGHFLLFTTAAKLLGEDTDASKDLYRYDDASAETLCLSCIGEGGFDVGIAPRPAISLVSWPDYSQRARPASADVSAVVFTTAEGLVDDDLNGAEDVYLWRGRALSLVSTGTGQSGMEDRGGISPDGRDVFFVTSTPMVGADKNNGLDLYDARVGGGFAEVAEAPICISEGTCLDQPTSAPPGETSGSDTFRGSGNPTQPKPCRKGFRRKHGKCVKKPKARAHKHGKKSQGKGKRANDNRGGQR